MQHLQGLREVSAPRGDHRLQQIQGLLTVEAPVEDTGYSSYRGYLRFGHQVRTTQQQSRYSNTQTKQTADAAMQQCSNTQADLVQSSQYKA